MLPWRLASRGFGGAGRLQRNALLKPAFKPRRTAYTNPAWNPYPPRAPGLAAKLWYRPDGKPRAKWKGALLAAFVAFEASALVAVADLVEEYDEANYKIIDAFFDAIDDIGYVGQPDAVHEIHGLMADFARELHQLLGNMKKEDVLQTGVLTLQIMDEAIQGIGRVYERVHAGGDDGEKLVFSSIVKPASKESHRGKEYESIG
ncbi:hypothetical protein EST38_g11593 [Candolleomyces aberdarensis]|uniref:Uncharacterized protein n=1 Tax=Candolleomyces aberdarensis TaxID=2316362 RepID=A0A4Q2D5Z1_9AGAR|nr:hypothetical protein EST38_g11593 [Candolleomyces aberdarensis]